MGSIPSGSVYKMQFSSLPKSAITLNTFLTHTSRSRASFFSNIHSPWQIGRSSSSPPRPCNYINGLLKLLLVSENIFNFKKLYSAFQRESVVWSSRDQVYPHRQSQTPSFSYLSPHAGVAVLILNTRPHRVALFSVYFFGPHPYSFQSLQIRKYPNTYGRL